MKIILLSFLTASLSFWAALVLPLILMKTGTLTIAGLMSGTSLDGLDIALCRFSTEQGKHRYELLAAETIAYEAVWKERLRNVFDATAEQYFKLHSLYGEYIAEQLGLFLKKHSVKPDYIASHGHTVFHRPQLGFSTQIGCGATIAAHTGIATICDFRSLDVALKGQGAPLVPVGDRDLFPEFESCLNIGGIANISFTKNGSTSAFDCCIANMAFNDLAEKTGKAYDPAGTMASTGRIHQGLLADLLSLHSDQRSLGKEWFDARFLPLLEKYGGSIEDQLATCVEYTALMIGNALQKHEIKSVLITGGGAYNTFLINRLKAQYTGHIEIPSDAVIQFKEAIVFAYLGYLRATEQTNTLSNVTKASRDSIGGCIYKA
jgi:anhydro-N-acetylmuramic acid kinase